MTAQINHRKNILLRIGETRNSTAILYITGDRQGLETKIGQDIIDLFVDHLDAIGPVDRISLILYTSGGMTSTAWNLVNLLHMFCEDLEVIVPGKCMSAGTLITLGANQIIMTKQATLGPIDPSLQHPLGPPIQGASPDARAPVSVEAVRGYLAAIKDCEAGEGFEGQALLDLSNKVHPLVLGQIFRARQQIRDLAKRLLTKCNHEQEELEKIIDFLCSDSGSHDYTINRREARELGLNVENCSEQLYGILQELRKSYSTDLELQAAPFDMNAIAQPNKKIHYSFTRAIIESPDYGAHHFVSEGEVSSQELPQQQPNGVTINQIAISDHRMFEGWRKIS